jgi:hypothetical protein
MQTETRYTIEASRPGTYAAHDTTNRKHVRGFVLGFAWRFGKHEGATIRIRGGRKFSNGPVLAEYTVRDGKWTHVAGLTVTGLEGLDGAGCYMAAYPLEHVTRSYAEGMAG